MSNRNVPPMFHQSLPVCLLVVFAAAGCGQDGPQRYEVSGTVTYNGQPLPYGDIHFDPDSKQGNHGPGAVAPIRGGSYATPSGKGIVGGPHVVRIYGSDGIAVEVPYEGRNEAGTPLFDVYTESVDFPEEDAKRDFKVSFNP